MRNARRSLTFLLVIIVGLAALIGIGVTWSDATVTPKLALDLQGGTEILLAAEQTGGADITSEQMQQAVSIIRQRVDAAGVSEAEVTTQGARNISVSIPGKADEATLKRIEASAKLDFRPVLVSDIGITVETQNPDGIPSAQDKDAAEKKDTPKDAVNSEKLDPNPLPKTAGDAAWVTPALQAKFDAFTCSSDAALDTRGAAADRPLITCDDSKTMKYILGPVELTGDVITDAEAYLQTSSNGASTGQWAIQVTMNKKGADAFGKVSTRLIAEQSPRNQFAFVLDGNVISAPEMQGTILDGRPSISGNFTEESAKALADQLKFGALPISFTVQSQEDISSTLGSNQLQAGLLAGVIGLLLVVVYSLFQYRALAALTVTSLGIAAVLTYLLLTFFSWRQGYRLSLAGVAGIIVAIGFTADSFIVYFERIRDALRDGYSIQNAVEHGWKKAFRTVLASDGVNFLAALILFLLAVGNVRGFAFTLGLTTLVDVLVVALFTHPMMVFLSRTGFYQRGHRFSGLDPAGLGAVYRGRAQYRLPVSVTSGSGKKNAKSRKEAERRQTIAERKAAALQGDSASGKES